MSGMQAFMRAGKTVNIDVSASSQAVRIGVGTPSVRICNNGSATVWIRFGDSTAVADPTVDTPVPGNGFTEVLIPGDTVNTSELYVAAIGAGPTGKIYFTPGVGL